jgi:hypothetical protein
MDETCPLCTGGRGGGGSACGMRYLTPRSVSALECTAHAAHLYLPPHHTLGASARARTRRAQGRGSAGARGRGGAGGARGQGGARVEVETSFAEEIAVVPDDRRTKMVPLARRVLLVLARHPLDLLASRAPHWHSTGEAARGTQGTQ